MSCLHKNSHLRFQKPHMVWPYVQNVNLYGLLCVTEFMSFLLYPNSVEYKQLQNKVSNTVMPRTLFWLSCIYVIWAADGTSQIFTHPPLTRRYFSGFERMGLDLMSSDFKLFGPLKKGVTGKQCEQNPKYSRLSSVSFNPWSQFVLRQYTSILTTVGQKLKYQ